MTPLAPITLEIAVLLLAIFLLCAECFVREENKRWMATTAIFVLAIVFAWSFFTTGNAAIDPGTSFYSADATALFFKRIALLTTIVVLVMSIEYRQVLVKYIPAATPGAGTAEFYTLPLFTCAGLMFMASAVDFLLIFVSLELVTISFYVLIAYMRRQSASLEAGVKYLILSALSTGFLVYGITWIFGLTGETNLSRIGAKLATLMAVGDPANGIAPGALFGSEAAVLFALFLVLIALGFKIAAAPFQLWVPDVYQGAPTAGDGVPECGFEGSRLHRPDPRRRARSWRSHRFARRLSRCLEFSRRLAVVYGNLAAMPQDNLKRLLAYSSIAHAGYLLVAVASIGPMTGSFGSSGVAVAVYLAGYLLMTLLSFLIMILVANHSRGDDILHFNGLAKRSPFLAFGMLIAMLSLAGLPFTAGFIGKFLVFAAAVQQQQFFPRGAGRHYCCCGILLLPSSGRSDVLAAAQ
jgi:NADH-quinone oxidoreductase subunit N